MPEVHLSHTTLGPAAGSTFPVGLGLVTVNFSGPPCPRLGNGAATVYLGAGLRWAGWIEAAYPACVPGAPIYLRSLEKATAVLGVETCVREELTGSPLPPDDVGAPL